MSLLLHQDMFFNRLDFLSSIGSLAPNQDLGANIYTMPLHIQFCRKISIATLDEFSRLFYRYLQLLFSRFFIGFFISTTIFVDRHINHTISSTAYVQLFLYRYIFHIHVCTSMKCTNVVAMMNNTSCSEFNCHVPNHVALMES